MSVRIEAIEFPGVNQVCARKMPEIIGSIQTKWLFKLYAYLIHNKCHKLRTDKAGLSVPLDIQVHCQKSEDIV